MARPPVEPNSDARLTITFALPPSDNNLYRAAGKGRAMTDEAKAWKILFLNALRKLKIRDLGLTPPYTLRIYLTFPDLRRRDVGNFEKLITDSIFHELQQDDTQVISLETHKFIRRGESPHIAAELFHSKRQWIIC